MKLSFTQKKFIKEHQDDDLSRLLLSASRYPNINIPFVVEQIISRKQIKEKLPSWYKNEDIIFPASIAIEQCSSEITALYKQRLVRREDHICDLTGGMGIDSYFFAQKVKQVTYIERLHIYCETALHNFSILGCSNIEVLEGNATELLTGIKNVDTFYIDPARRGKSNKRIFALQDCEPDLTSLLPKLLQKIIAKLSPMADISQTLSLLPGTTEIHVLAVKNEVKELLFVIKLTEIKKEPIIHCYNYVNKTKEDYFIFTFSEEKQKQVSFSNEVKTYLYEPNASILKAGAFKSICRLGIIKLHINSHLYTSDQLIEDFPGRKFKIQTIFPFNNKLCKTLAEEIPQANITTRNFPLTVDELRKRIKIKEGGNIYLFATTLNNNQKMIIKCTKV